MSEVNFLAEHKTKKTVHHPVGFWPVMAALGGNFVIFCLKLGGFIFSGSGAMFSEAIHSLADTANQALLMVGITKSRKQPDQDYAYGYGQERFAWALISACGIFFVGAGTTVYHGITTLILKTEIYFNQWVYIILAISFLVESITFALAWKELRRQTSAHGLKKIFRHGDPTTVAIVYEDGVALLGVLVAFISIWLANMTGKHHWDSIGSIVIGGLLGFISIVLINKNRGYLRRKSIPRKAREGIIKLLKSDPAIEKVLDFKSSIIDFGQYHVKCDVEFNGTALFKGMYKNGELKEEFEEVRDDYDDGYARHRYAKHRSPNPSSGLSA